MEKFFFVAGNPGSSIWWRELGGTPSATHKSGYRPLLRASEELSEKRKRIWYTKRERERGEGKAQSTRAEGERELRFGGSAASAASSSPFPVYHTAPNKRRVKSRGEGREGGERTRNETRGGRGKTLPRNADASRMHTRAHGSCTDVMLPSLPSPSANNKL